MPDRELAALASHLVGIESVNPDLDGGGSAEIEVARGVAEWGARAGLDVTVADAAPGRPNVLVTARGTRAGRSLLLNAHTDTVAVGAAGTEPRIDGDRLYGRGAYDMKTSIAVALLVARDAAAARLAGDVVVAAVADEEWASVGTEALVRAGAAYDAAVVLEPTELAVGVAHKGFVCWEVETRGRAAHGSRPDLGVDAIVRMGPFLVELRELARRLEQAPRHVLLGTRSVHASLVTGGTAVSTYPDRCVVSGERRTLPGETPADVENELRALVEAAGADASLRVTLSRDPFSADPEGELASVVRTASGSDVVGLPFWTDAALLADAGVPTVVFGPAGEGAHADVEWVDLPSAERVREVLRAVALTWCGVPDAGGAPSGAADTIGG